MEILSSTPDDKFNARGFMSFNIDFQDAKTRFYSLSISAILY